jgi:hypothetical protein
MTLPDEELGEPPDEPFGEPPELDTRETARSWAWTQQRVLTRRERKAQRPSQPATVLEAILESTSDLYTQAPKSRFDLSYYDPQSAKRAEWKERLRHMSYHSHREPIAEGQYRVSLHTILARQIRTSTSPDWKGEGLKYNYQELALLREKGYTEEDIQRWALALMNRSSLSAANDLFRPGVTVPPIFLVSLFLRRRRMQQSALAVLMHHVDSRRQTEPLTWIPLKVLVVRLLRHARAWWPESIPWIASLFTTETARIRAEADESGGSSPRMVSDLADFCNSFLDLLASPANLRPILSSVHQQDAQFQVLTFMATQSPALVVNQTGFKAIMKVQLAHAKTEQEMEWARLKGPSWPPWMQQRTAMDAEKGYLFGASRASRIMHQMFAAGYSGGAWENNAQVYAGWDTDLSPTIQTRTTISSNANTATNFGLNHSMQLLWAARVRTTRTRREAWACFLAYEESNMPPSQQVYQAMFEKLHYPELDPQRRGTRSESQEVAEFDFLPGDRKEVLPDPESPKDRIYIAEQVPSYVQLYQRMSDAGVRPTYRFLAFLMETSPDFSIALRVLESAKDDFDGGVQRLLDASIFDKPAVEETTGYFLTAFIRFLCNFGQWRSVPPIEPLQLSREEHERRFMHDHSYLFEYAYALLMYIRPHHRPAWTTYMHSVLYGPYRGKDFDRPTKIVAQYNVMCKLVDAMQEEHIDIDEEQFQLMCNVVRHAAEAVFNSSFDQVFTNRIVISSPRYLRSLFHSLVSGHLNENAVAPEATDNMNIPLPQTPSSSVLHSYVRALGFLHDHEGLYSLASWMRTHAAEVSARATAQHSGPRVLRLTLVSLRAGLEGSFHERHKSAPEELVELVKTEINGVEELGGWPTEEEVEMYMKGVYR